MTSEKKFPPIPEKPEIGAEKHMASRFEWGLGDFHSFRAPSNTNVCPVMQFLSSIRDQWAGIDVSDILIDSEKIVSVSACGQAGSIPAPMNVESKHLRENKEVIGAVDTTHHTHHTHTNQPTTHMISGTY